ncbi:MAG TPA: HAMP domain-containing sensor histidine kinase [Rectinemataceae bacterium]|nr:HAMP domain-containing sensor histidine kinase [Rectinemataceae bacterium]
MALDLSTLFWVLNLGYSGSIIFAIVLYKVAGSFSGGRLWILAQAMAAVGSLLFAERSSLPYPALVLANSFFVAGEAFYAHAIWAYRRSDPFPKVTYGIVVLMIPALFLLENSPASLRNALVSTAMASFAAWAAFLLLWGMARRSRYVATMTALPFVLVALGNFTEALLSLTRPVTWRFEDVGKAYAYFYLFSIATAPLSLFGFFLLATQRRQAILERQGAELALANESLRELDQIKDLFVSMLAHDLRGPISGASRYTRKHLLPEGIDIEAKRRSLAILANSLDGATALLDNVLLWSKSRQDKRPLAREELDLADEARSAIGLFLPTIEAKGLRVEEDLTATPLRAERESIEIIIRNMISNAIKFSPLDGEISVAAGLDGEGRPYVSVGDRGAGIDPEIRSQLFRIDRRVTTRGTAGESGSGFGLILCAGYAARIRASFGIEDRPGGGCLSTLVLLPGGGEPG